MYQIWCKSHPADVTICTNFLQTIKLGISLQGGEFCHFPLTQTLVNSTMLHYHMSVIKQNVVLLRFHAGWGRSVSVRFWGKNRGFGYVWFGFLTSTKTSVEVQWQCACQGTLPLTTRCLPEQAPWVNKWPSITERERERKGRGRETCKLIP